MRKDYVEPDDYEYEPTPHDEVLEKAQRHYPTSSQDVPRESDAKGGVVSSDAAMHFDRQTLTHQRVEIAVDGHYRNAQLLHQLVDSQAAFLLQPLQNLILTLA